MRKDWPVKDPDEKAHPVVNALSNACMQAARMQMIDVNYFFSLTTTISLYRRQLLFDS